MERELEDLQADWERFEQKMDRQRKIGMWCLIPYVAGAGMVGVGIGNVLDRPDMHGTVALLSVGFFMHVFTQWGQIYWTKWINDRKSAPSDG
jgi:F0F1-type ATP synthase assembly protein I